MLIPIILTFGCLSFICLGTAATAWAGVDISEEGPDVKNIIMFIAGLAVIVFAFHCIVESSEYYNKKVFTTSVPAQIDTTVTIKNGVVDTLYTYHLTEEK